MGSNRPWMQAAWPGRSGASLRISTQQGPSAKEHRGDWALFRLLQEANVQRQSSTEYHVLWPFDNGITVQYNLRTRSGTNPFNSLRNYFSFSCSESLN
jgi:type VI protein secretion system component VasK